MHAATVHFGEAHLNLLANKQNIYRNDVIKIFIISLIKLALFDVTSDYTIQVHTSNSGGQLIKLEHTVLNENTLEQLILMGKPDVAIKKEYRRVIFEGKSKTDVLKNVTGEGQLVAAMLC